MVARAPLESAPVERRLVLYDGVCGFCDRAVRWLLRRDGGRLLYAPLQGRTAAALRLRHPEIPEALETLVYLESRGGVEQVFLESAAFFRLAGQLRGPWRRLAWLGFLPRRLTDLAYRQFVKRRYRLFGRLDSCRVPVPEERRRFLD